MVLMLRWLAAWRRNKKLSIGLPVALAIFSLAGIATLHVDDDISQLQALPQQILAQEKSNHRPDRAERRSEMVCGLRSVRTANAGAAGSLYPSAGTGKT
ncbi:Predicted exporter [Citrobacter koseri]|uniref:Predicted exporter n=1 Tax=Citrobacter koseri TaxID=545 RepID=A0A2X2WFI8_CITKO|nr:Predicted exporter [Citrobacter koseri]